MQPADQLATLRERFLELQHDPLQITPFVIQARQQTELLNSLGPRYTEVLQQLLDRLESSALFSEESCSFSQKELLDSLQMWLDKARLQLSAGQALATPPAADDAAAKSA